MPLHRWQGHRCLQLVLTRTACASARLHQRLLRPHCCHGSVQSVSKISQRDRSMRSFVPDPSLSTAGKTTAASWFSPGPRVPAPLAPVPSLPSPLPWLSAISQQDQSARSLTAIAQLSGQCHRSAQYANTHRGRSSSSSSSSTTVEPARRLHRVRTVLSSSHVQCLSLSVFDIGYFTTDEPYDRICYLM